MEKLAENMQKMTEDDLLLVVQMIHDNKTADTWTKNDVDREHSFHVPAWYVRANELPQRASSKWISTHFQTASYASFGTSRMRRSFGSEKNILGYLRYLEWSEAFKRLHHHSFHPRQFQNGCEGVFSDHGSTIWDHAIERGDLEKG